MAFIRLALLTSAVAAATAYGGLKPCRKHNDCGNAQWCFFSYDKDHQPMNSGYCFAHGHEQEQEPLDEMVLLEEAAQAPVDGVKKFTPKGLKVSSLTVQAEEGREAKIVLESGKGAPFTLRVKDDVFALTKGSNLDVITVTPDGDVVAKTKVLAAGSLSSDKGFIINDVPQWRLVKMEDFSLNVGDFISDTPEDGELTTTKCQEGLFLLGGWKVLSKQLIRKTYQNLPKHDRLQVRAIFHFLDAWGGETAFLQMSVGKHGNMEYVWTETYDVSDYSGTVNVCGDDVGEGRFAVPVEISLPHSADVVTLAFGSTLKMAPSASPAFYGISSLEIYTRDSTA